MDEKHLHSSSNGERLSVDEKQAQSSVHSTCKVLQLLVTHIAPR